MLPTLVAVASVVVPPALPKVTAAVICPGFLTGDADFRDMAQALCKRGIPTAVVPFPVWHWIPQIGGRSVRPILERLDHTIRHVAAMDEEELQASVSLATPLVVPAYDYSVGDLLFDFMNNPGGVAEVGGSSYPDEYPMVDPRGEFPPPAKQPRGRVALIGHSAGGWIGRIYLSDRSYGGKSYEGSEFVHSLVTLGTPHRVGQGVPFISVAWANSGPPVPPGVRCLAVGGSGTPGTFCSLTSGAYSFCTPEGSGGELLDGDGITTIESALGIADGEGVQRQQVPGITHYCFSAAPFADQLAPELTAEYRAGKPWYGSEEVLDAEGSWSKWLRQEGSRA